MLTHVAVVILCGVTTAVAAPFRWQAPDGTRVEAEIVTSPDAPPRLQITKPVEATVALVGAKPGESLTVSGWYENVVLVGSARAWRLAWKDGRFAQVATAQWSAKQTPPAWARPLALSRRQPRDDTFDMFRQLLRFEGTLPGLERYLNDNEISVVISADPSNPSIRSAEKVRGSELLARWQREGFPLARGTPKRGGPGCTSLIENWPDKIRRRDHVPKHDPTGLRLAVGCVGRDLRLYRIEITKP